MKPNEFARHRPTITAKSRALWGTVLATLILATNALALPNDREQPVKVSADKLEANRSKNLSVYSGNVVIRQGSLQIRADRVEVHGSAKGEISKVVATGTPAHFQQQVEESTSPVKARARRIEFLVSSDALQLTGEAFVDRDGNTLSAERIDYDLNSEQMQAQGQSEKKRVEMIWKPESKPAEDGQ
ncbi:lipopolysaccharide transport periplasmic protein LptA [Microbulbifer hydrolyticus]|uniref:Lipopolysaccharide export system protein LptA n=1 Tax=Microbulbifer hydrolyticus TaxID=48074 RepID=A0A6P1TGE6_9GAMM|nr:lipopolysaccharide transport periplasmic protein LptA [Microbulbifer hydrolyticus]MBB5212200.1 lipopolysaccharide export system protein LptA [Microbulbifer hydrolyticus]QHQ39862.1 lipopolysaccharide transport periplasmic protein LptA [Microbulbifer hydrolyticus]